MRWVTGWMIGEFESRQELGVFLFTTASRAALGPTLPPIQRVPGSLSLGVKWPGRETNHSPPFSAEVKKRMELYFHSPNTPSWCGAQLKHRDDFTLPSINTDNPYTPCLLYARRCSIPWHRSICVTRITFSIQQGKTLYQRFCPCILI
jgi:hypothetical protein